MIYDGNMRASALCQDLVVDFSRGVNKTSNKSLFMSSINDAQRHSFPWDTTIRRTYGNRSAISISVTERDVFASREASDCI